MSDLKFFSLRNLLDCDATYNLAFGERSNGKTYSGLMYILDRFVNHKEAGAIVRRWDVDFKSKRGASVWDALVANNEVSTATGGKYTYVWFYGGRWHLAYNDEKNKRVIHPEPIAYAFALNTMEHDKSASYPSVTTIMFDEFLTRSQYLANEFVLFMNVVSTIVRHRTNVKIFMFGNTVNKYCPYFEEMGLHSIESMEPGDLKVYQYGEEGKLKVAVQYTGSVAKEGKPSDIYFAFNNPRLKMITGGAWEIDMYPHCPRKYRPVEVMFRYYISFNGHVLEAEVVCGDDDFFTFIHRKTSELKYLPDDLVFQEEYSSRQNIRRRIDKPMDNVGRRVYEFFVNDKVFYQSNEVGEIVRNYLLWCRTA